MSNTLIEVEASQPAVEVSSSHTLEINSELPETTVDVSKSITALVQPENYVIASEGMFGTSSGGAPQWILDAIQQQLTTGDGNLQSVLDDLVALTRDLQLGINQNLQQIQTAQTSISTLQTSVNSKIDQNQASMLDIVATKVTETEAQAIAANVLNTTFNGNVDAYIGNLASVYTDAGSAVATNIDILQASYNEQSVRIDSLDNVTITPEGWTLGSSKLATTPDNSIVGWQFSNGSNEVSEFKINAQRFSISDGTTGYTPFSISGNDINFLGKVSFNSVTGAPTHTSGLLSARPTTAVTGSTYTANDDPAKLVLYTYTDTGWVQGGDPDALIAADLGPTGTTIIDGGRIATSTLRANQMFANRLVNVSAYRTDGSINEALVTMDINLGTGSIYIK